MDVRMSNIEMYVYATRKVNKYSSPYWSKQYFSNLYTEQRGVLFRSLLPGGDTTEEARAIFRHFLDQEDFGSSRKIYLPERVFHITSVKGIFYLECNGKVTQRPTLIAPRSDESNTYTDFSEIPSDFFPTYIEGGDAAGNFLEIRSKSIPRGVRVKFIRRPKNLNVVVDPEGFTEETREIQHAIINMCVQSFEITVQNYNTAQMLDPAIQESKII